MTEFATTIDLATTVVALLKDVPQYLSIAATVVAVLISILGAFRAGVLKKVRFGSLEIEGVDTAALQRIHEELANTRDGEPIPFEIEQLANYYAVNLAQSKISFWFSLVFAAIGFMIIVGAAFIYKDGDSRDAIIKIISGIIIDSVAALFFVQSRRAQEAMGVFFEKLRTDRQLIEARKLCEEISDAVIKDNIKTILVLHYSGLESRPMMDVLVNSKRNASAPDKSP